MATIIQAPAAKPLDRVLQWFLTGAILVWLIITSGGIFPVLMLGGGTEFDEEARSQLRFLLLPGFVLAPLLLLLRMREVVRLLARNLPLVMLLVWIALSMAWSMAPELTGRRVLVLIINTMIVCYLVVDWPLERILRILSWCFLILFVASLAFIVLRPDIGVMPDGRGLRGAFTHKNPMGEAVVIGLIVFFAALRGKAIGRRMGFLGLGLALLLLIPVGAASSIAVAMIILAIQAYLLTSAISFQQRLMILAFAIAIGCVVMGVAAANVDAILDLFGRDTTLTGRTEIWSYALHMSAQRPWLGYGYNCFWEVERFAAYVIDRFDWVIPTAHNGYLEILLGLGWIGLMLLLGFFLNMAYRLFARWRRHSPMLIAFALPLLAFQVMVNMTESFMVGSSGLGWIVMAIAALSLTPDLSNPAKRALKGG